jgi:PadR family transcriptional regulator, regulatory protein PadR
MSQIVMAHAAPSSPPRELLSAWSLLLLNRRPIHGYELRRQLEAHGLWAEPGAIYRLLRKLEHDGSTVSRWAKSLAGPRRRLYELTSQGQADLDRLVTTVTAERDRLGAFLHAYDSAAAR